MYFKLHQPLLSKHKEHIHVHNTEIDEYIYAKSNVSPDSVTRTTFKLARII